MSQQNAKLVFCEILKKQNRGNPKTSKSNLKLILTKISA